MASSTDGGHNLMPSRETMAAQAAGDSSLGSFHDGAGEDAGF